MNEAEEHSSPFHEEMLETIQARLFGYILSFVANAADAQDILQETNRVILRKADELRKAERFTAWAFRIAYFQTLSFCKQRKHSKIKYSETVLETLATEGEQEDRQIEGRLSRLESCLTKLKERTRIVVRDYYYTGNSVRHIAEERGLQENHVMQILFRARKALHECMTRLEGDENE